MTISLYAIGENDNYNEQWKKVIAFEEKGLPKSALQVVEIIYKKAKAEKNSAQFIKASIYKMKFKASLEEDAILLNINDLKQETAISPFPEKQLLHSILGEMYWGYYQQNRYRFLGRTEVAGTDSLDLQKWDLKKIVAEVEKQFLLSLTDSSRSKKISIEKFNEIVEPGTELKVLRPTLYDFLAHRAIDFFANNEANLPQSAPAFSLNDPHHFSNAESFSRLKLADGPKQDFLQKAIILFQQLTKYRLADTNQSALVDLELKRLEFVYQRSILPLKDTLYLNALSKINSTYKKHSLHVKVGYTIASFHHQQAAKYQPLVSQKNKWENKLALEICTNLIAAFPKDLYIKDCRNLLAEIQMKELELTMDYVELPGTAIKALVKYRNVENIYTRIYKTSGDELSRLLPKKDAQDRDNYLEGLSAHFLSTRSLQSFSTKLPDDKDLQKHAVELAIPALTTGEYLLLTGTDSTFSATRKAIAVNFIKISNLSYINKINASGEMEIFVLHRATGQTLKNVNAQLWLETNNGSASVKTKGEIYITDEQGYFKIKPFKNNQQAFTLELSTADDKLRTGAMGNQDYYNGGYFFLPDFNEPSKQNVSATFFFTDRGIYRPGQTIFFKGICVQNAEDGKHDLIKNKAATVILYDANNQKVSDLKLTTNDFGSFNGSFQLPSSGLTGQMRISDGIGDIFFPVEEYKRPGFEITFPENKNTYRLNDTVTVEGVAKAYSGANISGAKVSYRVVRNAVFPIWWWQTGKSVMPRSPSMEISHGTTLTDAEGKFHIPFIALPDAAVSREQRPEYIFTVYADVTDLNGENQGNETSLVISYTSLKFTINIPEVLSKKESKSFKINATNLAGIAASANGTMSIYRLKDPGRPFRARNWEQPDTFLYTPEVFKTYFPEDPIKDENNFIHWPRGKEVFLQNFETIGEKSFELSGLANWEDGRYLAEIKSKDRFGAEVVEIKYFILLDKASTSMPYQTVDWFSLIKKVAVPKDKAQFLIGSVKDLRILYDISKDNKLLSREWISLNNAQRLIDIPVKVEYAGNIDVRLNFVFGNRFYVHNETVTVPFVDKELDITFETFRDKLEPGQKEEWKIKITSKNSEKLPVEMLATLYDASLDKFNSNKFQFDIYANSYASNSWESTGGFITKPSELLDRSWNSVIEYSARTYDALRQFGFNFRYQDRYMLRKGAGSVNNMAMATPKFEEGEVRMALTSVRDSNIGDEAIPAAKTITDENKTAVRTRTNFNETAFFYPTLKTDDKGSLLISFTIPEALTRWKMLGLAHTQDLKTGLIERELITQKDLMTTLFSPRFFRSGDRVKLITKIDNLSTKNLTGKTEIHFFDTFTNQNIDSLLGLKIQEQDFEIAAGSNVVKEWTINIPGSVNAITYRIKASAGSFADGEEKSIPVLSHETLITESFPFDIKGKQQKVYNWDKFTSNNSTTSKNHRFVFEYSSNPVWYAIRSIPYILEQNNECSEQLFNRFYANSLGTHLVNSNPKIAAIFLGWKNAPGVLKSPLEKNDELKNTLLAESPWLAEAATEREQQNRIALLFDLNHMNDNLAQSFKKLKQMQHNSGGWPWFAGMREDQFITQYIVTGLGRLDHLGVQSIKNDPSNQAMLKAAIAYMDKAIQKTYTDIKASVKKGNTKASDNHLSPFIIQYLYARSYFKNIAILKGAEEAYSFFQTQTKKNWNKESIYMKGMIALSLFRTGDLQTPAAILRSLKEYALHDESMGMYFKNESAYYWYQAPVERQALLIEVFDEVGKDTNAVEDLKLWLLKQKQTNNWKTSKATAEACYALLLKGNSFLENSESPQVVVGKEPIAFGAEAGTGYMKKTWNGSEIKKDFGHVNITTTSIGNFWGSLYWQYFEKMDKVTSSETSLKVNKKIFLQQNSNTGPQIISVDSSLVLHKGDLLKIRLEVHTDRNMEYVHLKDLRASGLEPVSVISGYQYQDGLGYYQSTLDASTNFFIDHLPKGNYVIEYALRVAQEGNFSNGLATLQCMYAPEFSAHTNGTRIEIK